MAQLNPKQQGIARLLESLAMKRGLPEPRADEFAAAALSESGLRPGATNASSGAAGLFQLLSGGYRKQAMQGGGLNNPTANALAILPQYLKYWQTHPNAAPGQAGAAVEASGQGANFYSKGLGQIEQVGGGAAGVPLAPRPTAGLTAAPDRNALMQQIVGELGHTQPNIGVLSQAIQQTRQVHPPPSPIDVMGHPGPPPSGAGGTAGGFLPTGAAYKPGRADQGRDFQTRPGAPIVSPGAGYVVRVGSDPRGFGPNYPIVHFTSGPYAGKTMYIGHTHSAVRAGQRVTQGQVLARTGTSPVGNASVPGWAEIGFAGGGNPGSFGQPIPFK